MKVFFFIQCNLKGSRRKQKLSATMSGNFLYVKCNLLSVRGARNYLGTGPKVVSQRTCLQQHTFTPKKTVHTATYLSTTVRVFLCAMLYRSSAELLGVEIGVISHDFSGYPLSPRKMEFPYRPLSN